MKYFMPEKKRMLIINQFMKPGLFYPFQKRKFNKQLKERCFLHRKCRRETDRQMCYLTVQTPDCTSVLVERLMAWPQLSGGTFHLFSASSNT
jgi:hypothetical protein